MKLRIHASVSIDARIRRIFMKKLAAIISTLFVISACTPVGVLAPATTTTTVSANQGTNVRNAIALPFDEVVPHRGSAHVTVHPHVRLMASSCSRIISLAFSTSHTYPNTVIALKNRAAIVGANALAVTNWIESSSHMYLDAHFYYCPSKSELR